MLKKIKASMAMSIGLFATIMPMLCFGVPDWQLGPFERVDQANPVLLPSADSLFYCPIQNKEVHWEAEHIFNPGAPNALQGMNYIAELYGSEKEKEFGVAHELAKKIHTYYLAARHLLGPDACKVPSPTVPCEIPEDQRSLPHKVIVEVALPILAVACSLAECYGTFSTAYGFVVKAIAFDRKEKNGPFKLALELAQLAKSFHVV